MTGSYLGFRTEIYRKAIENGEDLWEAEILFSDDIEKVVIKRVEKEELIESIQLEIEKRL